jgi:hypothetical protein
MPKNMHGGNKAKKQSNKKVQQKKDDEERAEREIYVPPENSTMKICLVEKVHNIRDFTLVEPFSTTTYFGRIMEKSNNRLVGKIKTGSVIVGETLDCMKGKLNVFHLYSENQIVELQNMGKFPIMEASATKEVVNIFGEPQSPNPDTTELVEDDEFDFDDI